MNVLIYPFLALSAAGFAALLAVHVASLFGVAYPFERFAGILGPGIFVVFLPTIFVMNRLTWDFKRKDIRRASLRGCPTWMRRTVWTIFGYSWLGFFILPLIFGGGMDSATNKARIGSGAGMVFYLIPFAILYSAINAQTQDESRHCLNGHNVSPLAKFCEECGAPVAPSTRQLT